MRVLTIDREYGCGAPIIAERLADHLGWALWDQSLTTEIVKTAKVAPEAARRCDERLDAWLHRLAKTFWHGYARSFSPTEPGAFDTDCMVSMVQLVIEDAARHGNCVIVGRGAPYLLRDRKDAFHVFLFAPWEEKIRRLVHSGKTQSEAEELLETVDRERADFIKHYFGKEWPDHQLYHLGINTAIGDDNVIAIVLNTMHACDAVRNP
jgi:cytidylate kinase-like protein